jgi:transposase
LSQLEGWLRQHPDATLEWLRARVVHEMELHCSLMGVFRAVRKLGWSLKKKRFERPNKIARTSRGGA